MELFRPEIEGDLLYIDLDTVVCGSLEPLAAVGKFTLLRDFYCHDRFGSGLMYLTEEIRAELWKAWTKRAPLWMRECTRTGHWGDQGFISHVVGSKADVWQGVLPGKAVSYKCDLKHREPDKDTSVVCFHGFPRPWQIKRKWIPPCGPSAR